jgi:hypothetical protein
VVKDKVCLATVLHQDSHPSSSLSKHEQKTFDIPLCVHKLDVISVEHQNLDFFEKTSLDGILGLSFGQVDLPHKEVFV